MKICVTASSPSLDALIDPRFGRCAYFIIVDPDTTRFEAIPNPAAGATMGAGIQAAQLVVGKGVKAVLTGSVGPNAFQVLLAAGVKILVGPFRTVKEAVEMYKKGQVREVASPLGRRFGMGRGLGRRMGW